MRQHKAAMSMILICLFLCTLSRAVADDMKAAIGIKGNASNVIDGDTFDVVAENGTQYRVRLADVDAPERDEPGYDEAAIYLGSLVYGITVFLDIDDMYTYDDHGMGDRIVCIVYINHNATHYINVNEALFEAGNVEKRDYANEFTPYDWEFYIAKKKSTEFPLEIFLAGVAIVVTTISLVYLKRSRWRQYQ